MEKTIKHTNETVYITDTHEIIPVYKIGAEFSLKDKLNLSIHDCQKCHGKLVVIEMNNLGQTCCGYCHEPVDYMALGLQQKAVQEELLVKVREGLKE